MSTTVVFIILCGLWGMITAIFGYGPLSIPNVGGLLFLNACYAYFYFS